MGDPYVKLLSTTNITSATLEFQQARGGNSTLKISNPTNSGSGSTSTPTPGSSPTAISLADLQRKIDHLQNLEPIFFAVLGVNVLIMAAAVGLGIWFCCCRRRKSNNSDGSGRKFMGKSTRRGRAGLAGGNTISTMELTTKEDNGTSYAPVSTLNPDGEPMTPPGVQSAYDPNGPVGARQSTVSFRTDPFRHSRTLSGVSAFRPMVPTSMGSSITTGPEPMTPGSEKGFDLSLPSPTTPERARVSSMPALNNESYRRQSSMPPLGAMMAPGLTERYRTSSFGTPKDVPIPESEPGTPTRLSNPSKSMAPAARQPSPLSSPIGEKILQLGCSTSRFPTIAQSK